jgi:hypothetical protein|nr:hypothetical protein [Kofleriaceae bacterium]
MTESNPSEELETNERFTPSEEWIAEYRNQATAKLISGLNNFARNRALAVADTGRKVDDYYARELVLDALGDTWLGVVCWDPAKCSLAHHLVRTIEGRSDKHRKQSLRRPHDALDDGTPASRAAEVSASELRGDGHHAVARVHTGQTMAQIRAAAAKDKPVLRIIDAYDAGCETKEEVLAHAHMKSRTYHNAYGRLKRIVRHLTDRTLATKLRA